MELKIPLPKVRQPLGYVQCLNIKLWLEDIQIQHIPGYCISDINLMVNVEQERMKAYTNATTEGRKNYALYIITHFKQTIPVPTHKVFPE